MKRSGPIPPGAAPAAPEVVAEASPRQVAWFESLKQPVGLVPAQVAVLDALLLGDLLQALAVVKRGETIPPAYEETVNGV